MANTPATTSISPATRSMIARASSDDAGARPTSAIARPEPSVAVRRLRPHPSITEAVTTSSSETAEVTAATARARKKTKPTRRPTPPIAANALGSEMNSVPMVLSLTCPERPSAKITGNTTRPAPKATAKSDSDTTVASRLRFSRRDT